jgi:TRAP-type mannitol/chloroaromatic compound transport system permease small subunit
MPWLPRWTPTGEKQAWAYSMTIPMAFSLVFLNGIARDIL